MDKIAIKISDLFKCPVFGDIWKDIFSRDWKTISKEINEIMSSLDKYIGMTIEPINKIKN